VSPPHPTPSAFVSCPASTHPVPYTISLLQDRPPERQILIFGGRKLDPARCVGDYGITAGLAVHVGKAHAAATAGASSSAASTVAAGRTAAAAAAPQEARENRTKEEIVQDVLAALQEQQT